MTGSPANQAISPQHAQPLRVDQLRDLLRQKYPEAHRSPAAGQIPSSASPRCAVLPPNEALTLNALEGQFTEITGGDSPEACPGVALILHHLLELASKAGRGLVLVDGADRFDPQSYPAPLCRNLFWARCKKESGQNRGSGVQMALKVTDLFLRDGNLPLVVLDLFQIPEQEVARVNLSIWYRLRQLTEQNGSGLCLLTARSTGPAAHRRLALVSSFTLDALDLPRSALLPQLRLRLERTQSRRTAASPSLTLDTRRIA